VDTLAAIVANPGRLVRAIQLAEKLERLTLIIAGRQVMAMQDPVTGNIVFDLRNLTSSGVPEADTLPIASADGQVLVADSTQPGGVRWV
jgi:hypothetical protein